MIKRKTKFTNIDFSNIESGDKNRLCGGNNDDESHTHKVVREIDKQADKYIPGWDAYYNHTIVGKEVKEGVKQFYGMVDNFENHTIIGRVDKNIENGVAEVINTMTDALKSIGANEGQPQQNSNGKNKNEGKPR